jgi:lysophospholipase L1-like esterase
MIDCLIIGDSIAKGLGDVRRDCMTIAKVGINSQDFLGTYSTKLPSSNIVIISLSTNDSKDMHTHENLWLIRQRIDAQYVIWILPNDTRAETIEYIEALARDFNDGTIKLHKDWLSKDNIHPTGKGYKELGKATMDVVD